MPQTTRPVDDQGQCPPPGNGPVRRWCVGSREDPLTGLIAFPDFHRRIADEIAAALCAGNLVGLAIGDVDGLKQYVERSNASDPQSFGHLAGNRVMARLGAEARAWFERHPFPAGCVATFGGDEVIVAATVPDSTAFLAELTGLRDLLSAALPTTVSFAFMLVADAQLPVDRSAPTWRNDFADLLLAKVDHCLFAHKHARGAGGEGGVVAAVEPPGARSHEGGHRTLLPLPVADEHLHVLARPVELGGHQLMLLPCIGPNGLRGTRLRIRDAGGGTRTSTAISVDGHAAVPSPRSGVGSRALRVSAVRPRRSAVAPDDLVDALKAAGLEWERVPDQERCQIMQLIREAASADVRRARIASAVEAAARFSRRGR